MIWSKIYYPILITLLFLMLVACQMAQKTMIASATATPTPVVAGPASPKIVSPTPKPTIVTLTKKESVTPTVIQEYSMSGFTLPDLPIEVSWPKQLAYAVSEQVGPEDAFASYRFQSSAECEGACLQEMSFFSLASCSTERCLSYMARSYNEAQDEVESRLDKIIDHPCEEGPCVRDYVTYLGNVVISTRLELKDKSQIDLADDLFAQLDMQATDLVSLLSTREAFLQWIWQVGIKSEPTEVQRLLLKSGWISQEEDWQALDIDGDGQEEWLITLVEDVGLLIGHDLPTTSVLIIDDGKIIFERSPMPREVYRILSTKDITGDDLPDIVVEYATYGANYYPLQYHVFSTHHGRLKSVVQPPANVDESYSFDDGDFIAMGVDNWEEVHVLHVSEDGLDDLILTGIAGGGGAGGVSRPFRAIWSWDGEAITLADVTWQETKYRFHALYNANDAFEKGEFESAYLLYHKVLFDELLSDEVSSFCSYDQDTDRCERISWATSPELYAINRQFAAFRLMLLPLVSANNDADVRSWRGEAVYWRDWLHKSYPDAPLSEAADLLLSEWDATEALDTACQAVSASLSTPTSTSSSEADVMGPLVDMGYNNPSLMADSLCVLPAEVVTQAQPNSKSALAAELEEIVLPKLLEQTAQSAYIAGNENINILPLRVKDDQQPLWAVFTTGSVGDYPAIQHFFALYTHKNEQWQEVAQLAFSEPNYIDDSSVRQVDFHPDYLWFEISGGVGANGSQYKVLRFDGQQLHVEMDHLSSRHGGFGLAPIDLDEDGSLELVLSPLENYVFCIRQCGVRYYKFMVLRWNENADSQNTQNQSGFTEVPLTELSKAVPADLRNLNNRAVELAKAGLWKDALSIIRQARAIDYTARNPYVTWNEVIINLHAEATFKHTLDNGKSNYPLLATILYGDYDEALNMMRGYPVEKLFTSECPLVVGTMASGWKRELNDWISKAVEKALSPQPELAAAYFLRGWSTYLVNPNNTQALLDIERAAELAPDEPLFQESLIYLTK